MVVRGREENEGIRDALGGGIRDDKAANDDGGGEGGVEGGDCECSSRRNCVWPCPPEPPRL